MIHKNLKEIEIYSRYKKWLYLDFIPLHIVENYKRELELYKKSLLK